MVREAVTHPPASPEPDVIVTHHPAPQQAGPWQGYCSGATGRDSDRGPTTGYPGGYLAGRRSGDVVPFGHSPSDKVHNAHICHFAV